MSIYHRYVLSFGILSFDLRWVNHTFWSNVHFTQDHKIMWLFKSWHSQPRILTNEGSNQSQYMSQKKHSHQTKHIRILGWKTNFDLCSVKSKRAQQRLTVYLHILLPTYPAPSPWGLCAAMAFCTARRSLRQDSQIKSWSNRIVDQSP